MILNLNELFDRKNIHRFFKMSIIYKIILFLQKMPKNLDCFLEHLFGRNNLINMLIDILKMDFTVSFVSY